LSSRNTEGTFEGTAETCSSDLHIQLSSPLFGLGNSNRTPGYPRPSRSLAIDFFFAPNVAAIQAFSPPPTSLALFSRRAMRWN
jgi:hypothetical protein